MIKTARWHALLERIKNIQDPIGIELGVHRGQMSRELLKTREDLTLYMIDSWTPYCDVNKSNEFKNKYHDSYIDNMTAATMAVAEFKSRAIIIRGDSARTSKIIGSPLDFVFIDADHEYESVKKDIRNWFWLIKKNGFICGHDFSESWPGVKQAVNEFFESDIEIDVDDTWFVRV